jgi:predicted Zn-ribbon and HTH transcriptional regulator
MPTIRQEIIELLSVGAHTARDISQLVGIREKEVYNHLSYISRSVAAQKKKLHIIPAECIACGHEFKDRKRFTKPGRCPRCKSERIREPSYQVV